MNVLKITRIEPCRVASFHVRDSLSPEGGARRLFCSWAEANGLLKKFRLLPVLGFNNPWGAIGKPRGYEIWCFLEGLGEVDLAGVTVKHFQGGLFAVTTIPGLDLIGVYPQQLRVAIGSHPCYETDYPAYRHGIDPVPEFEMIYTPGAQRAEDFVLDYFIPIKEKGQQGAASDAKP